MEYYDNVCKQYSEFIDEIKDLEGCVQNSVVSPETLENVKTMLEPLKQNWQMMNYIVFLLNKPNKKSKHKVYQNQNKKLIKDCITDKDVYKQNNDSISEIKNLTNSLRG